jgi:hypothetical protein
MNWLYLVPELLLLWQIRVIFAEMLPLQSQSELGCYDTNLQH